MVYGSNLPLIYGNATGGIVELETINELQENELKFSLGLANIGFLTSLKLSQSHDQDFIQLYGNYQFSKTFTTFNQEAFDFIDNFSVRDLGINFHKRIRENIFFNVYSYLN